MNTPCFVCAVDVGHKDRTDSKLVQLRLPHSPSGYHTDPIPICGVCRHVMRGCWRYPPHPEIRRLRWYALKFAGKEYVRMTPHSWALWQGESLELQDPDDSARLEDEFNRHLTKPE